MKSWKREKQEEGEIGKNTMGVINSCCSSSALSTAGLSLG